MKKEDVTAKKNVGNIEIAKTNIMFYSFTQQLLCHNKYLNTSNCTPLVAKISK